jgi:hypothetical protein
LLTLNNFEEIVDSTILQRGRGYYTSKRVSKLTKHDDGWTARVDGSYYYHVEIEALEDGSVLTDCDCPYDWGPYCKHIAAVLYAIRDGNIVIVSQPTSAKTENKETVTEIIQRLSHEQLVSILIKTTKKDRELANWILLEHGTFASDKAEYVRIIDNGLDAFQDRYGFIDYKDAHRAVKPCWHLLSQAGELIEDGKATSALPMLQAIIETVTPVLGNADDSDGSISGCVSAAFEVLEDSILSLKHTEKHNLFLYCIENISQKIYDGFGYDESFSALAGKLVCTAQERTNLFDALDRKIAQFPLRERFNRYKHEQVLQVKLNIMYRDGDKPESIHQFLKENVHLDTARRQLVQIYIELKQFKSARELCSEAIVKYENQLLPGLVIQYRKLLLEIARQANDTDAVLRLAEELLLEDQDTQYYDLLRDIISDDDWNNFVKELIETVKTKARPHMRVGLLGHIYIEEKMWTELIKLAQQTGIRTLTRYEQYLHPNYPEECCEIYKEQVYNMLKRTSDRSTYHSAGIYLTQMIKLGQIEEVIEIVDDLKKSYSNRRAMVDELNKIL